MQMYMYLYMGKWSATTRSLDKLMVGIRCLFKKPFMLMDAMPCDASGMWYKRKEGRKVTSSSVRAPDAKLSRPPYSAAPVWPPLCDFLLLLLLCRPYDHPFDHLPVPDRPPAIC
jgi:hypothetical protein